ncbi:MAG: DNA-binding protein [Cyanobacteria bacterium P01_G01_bin.19]
MSNKQFWQTIALTIIFSVLMASPVAAEEPIEQPNNREYWSCCQGYSYGNNFRSYDLQTTEALEGEVISLNSFLSRKGFPGTHLMIKTDKETIKVHLAPSWFLAEQDFDLTSQGKITVIGSRINVDGQKAIIARKIVKGDKTLVLRDLNGFPVWRRGQIPTIDN